MQEAEATKLLPLPLHDEARSDLLTFYLRNAVRFLGALRTMPGGCRNCSGCPDCRASKTQRTNPWRAVILRKAIVDGE